jgi:hypothetical protein
MKENARHKKQNRINREPTEKQGTLLSFRCTDVKANKKKKKKKKKKLIESDVSKCE